MQRHVQPRAAGPARLAAANSFASVSAGSHEASCSNLSDCHNEESAVVDLETYDVGEYHLTSCPICLEHFTLDNPAILLKCEHGFHLQCLESWRQRSSMCPMCFAPVVGDEGRLMSSSDARRRRRLRLRPPPANSHSPERSAPTGPATTDSRRPQPLLQPNYEDDRVSEHDEDADVIEVTAENDGVHWIWTWLRQCCPL
ncbi:Zinc finger C3HC4 type (RING finger) protein [Novymonas esmeraldas]|uniref:RING-type E3 ubiquitin transferase n=1 Tax=Novymonas esmeraldas TaxID=1808958 RepID=A0AAW0EZP5_9TRYP